MRKVIIVLVVSIISLMSCNTSSSETSKQITEETDKGPSWETKFYVDDFGDPTTNSYITIQTEGDFSNSATEGSDLTVILAVDEDDLRINLYEYNEGPSLTFDSGTGGVVKFKVGDEVISVKTLYDDKEGDLMFWSGGISVSNASKYLDKIITQSIVKCVIEIKEHSVIDRYNFDIPTKNLEDLLNK